MEVNLSLPPSFKFESQRFIGYMAANLDRGLEQLEDQVRDLRTEQLEWQIKRGRNSIGMLLAHIAVAEAYWINVPHPTEDRSAQADSLVQAAIYVRPQADGMPISPRGHHPDALRGWSLSQYLDLLRRARNATLRHLESWSDDDLETSWVLGESKVQILWILHHVLSHQAHHTGQITLLKEMMLRKKNPV